MSNQVYANNMEVSCKQAAGKSICAFPDVCMTPPQTPATPPGVPIPYPNTGMASDTSDGSSTVKISGQEVMLKNKSFFKRSAGDEAGCAPKKGVVTSKNMGKVYFTNWSMDVKVEGENVVRMMDLTTHNHASAPGNGPPWLYADEVVATAMDPICNAMGQDIQMEQESQYLPESMQPRNPDTKPSTLAVGYVFRSNGSIEVNPAHSSVSARRVSAARKRLKGKKFADYAQGKKRSDKKSSVNTCAGAGKNDGPEFVYEKSRRPKEGHAEAKIIEQWFREGADGVLVLRVTRPVCPHCARLIRAVNCSSPSGGQNCNRIKVCPEGQDEKSKDLLRCD